MKDVEYYFESSLIQRMELTLIKALQWRLGPITPYSYLELLWKSDIHSLPEDFTATVTKLLLTLLLGNISSSSSSLYLIVISSFHVYNVSDDKFVEFRPSVIAMSAIEYISKEVQLSSTNKAFLNTFNSLVQKYIKEVTQFRSERIFLFPFSFFLYIYI